MQKLRIINKWRKAQKVHEAYKRRLGSYMEEKSRDITWLGT